ncbi:MAG: CarD family transcriptional regulator [Chloroflexota bacterium]
MQFEIGDVVIHPAYGVSHIIAIGEKQFPGMDTCLYYEIALPKSTIWIPVDAQEAIGIRFATTQTELDQYRALLKSPPTPLKNNQPLLRHTELAKRLRQGSFAVMCEAVRDLTAFNSQKPLGVTIKSMLQKTRERLCQEWAIAADISVDAANEEIDRLLQTSSNG